MRKGERKNYMLCEWASNEMAWKQEMDKKEKIWVKGGEREEF